MNKTNFFSTDSVFFSMNQIFFFQVICDSDSMPSRRILEVAKEQVWRMVVKSIDWSTEGDFGSAPWKCTPGQTPRPKIVTHFLQIYSADQTKSVRVCHI